MRNPNRSVYLLIRDHHGAKGYFYIPRQQAERQRVTRLSLLLVPTVYHSQCHYLSGSCEECEYRPLAVDMRRDINLTGTALRSRDDEHSSHRRSKKSWAKRHLLERMVSNFTIRTGGCRVSYCTRLDLTTARCRRRLQHLSGRYWTRRSMSIWQRARRTRGIGKRRWARRTRCIRGRTRGTV